MSGVLKLVYEWACTDEFKKSGTNLSLNASIPLPDFPQPVGGKLDFTKVSDWQKKQCNETLNRLDTSLYEKVTESVLSPIAKDAIAAWQECHGKGRSANGLQARITQYSPVDQRFTLDLEWHSSAAVPKAPTISADSEFVNVTCTPAIPKSGVAPSGRQYACVRQDPTLRAFLRLNTDHGPLYPAPMLPRVTNAQGCAKGCTDCAYDANRKPVCLACSFRPAEAWPQGATYFDVPDDHGCYEGHCIPVYGPEIVCAGMPVGRPVKVSSVGPLTLRGTVTGDAARGPGNVDWGYTMAVDVDFGSGQWQDSGGGIKSQANISTQYVPFSGFGGGVVTGTGPVRLRLHNRHTCLWPCSYHDISLEATGFLFEFRSE